MATESITTPPVPQQRIATPWGRSDYARQFAEGIVFYGTPSHGGIRLSAERYTELPAAFRGTEFAGRQWFEEDCDIVKIMVSFPQIFEHELTAEWVVVLRHFEAMFPSLVPALLEHWKAESLEWLAGRWSTRVY